MSELCEQNIEIPGASATVAKDIGLRPPSSTGTDLLAHIDTSYCVFIMLVQNSASRAAFRDFVRKKKGIAWLLCAGQVQTCKEILYVPVCRTG